MAGVERAIMEPSRWELLGVEEQLKVLQRADRANLSSHLNQHLRPVDLFCYLGARFGEPNGMVMQQQEPSTANLIHWQYVFQCGTDVLSLEGTNRAVEFHLISELHPTREEWAALEARIKEAFQGFGQPMGKVRKQLERWELFINPFQRNRRRADEIEVEIRALDLSEPDALPPVLTKEQHERFNVQYPRWVDSMNEAAGLALSLRMLTPVLAESFVNLCIFLLAKPEVRSDRRLLDATIRAQIDVRVRRLHLDCGGFTHPIDTNCGAFTAFHTLMNARNDLYHGNVEPKKLTFDTVYLHGAIPLFADDEILPFRGVRAQLMHNDPQQALTELQVVHDFTQLVLQSLEADASEALQVCMDEPHLAWNENARTVASLFPARVAFAYRVESE